MPTVWHEGKLCTCTGMSRGWGCINLGKVGGGIGSMDGFVQPGHTLIGNIMDRLKQWKIKKENEEYYDDVLSEVQTILINMDR